MGTGQSGGRVLVKGKVVDHPFKHGERLLGAELGHLVIRAVVGAVVGTVMGACIEKAVQERVLCIRNMCPKLVRCILSASPYLLYSVDIPCARYPLL